MLRPERKDRGHNYDAVTELVAKRVESSTGPDLGQAAAAGRAAAGYAGSARNFRRLVADAESVVATGSILAAGGRRSGRRVTRWSSTGACWTGVHVFCAVLAWSRVRFVRFADNERADTTLAMLAECFETLGGVPKIVLADRMGCLKAGVVADVVVPTADYVRFATHYRFRPGLLPGRATRSRKGIVENLVGYAKTRPDDPRTAVARRTWPRRTGRRRRGAPR